jgi:hypothetical protein
MVLMGVVLITIVLRLIDILEEKMQLKHKEEKYMYRRFCSILILVVVASTAMGTEYRGDQYRSPIMHFLHSLFLGESSRPAQFDVSSSESQTVKQDANQTTTFPVVETNRSSTPDMWSGVCTVSASRYAVNTAKSGSAFGTNSVSRRSYTTSPSGINNTSGFGRTTSGSFSGDALYRESSSSALSYSGGFSPELNFSRSGGGESSSLNTSFQMATLNANSALDIKASLGFNPPPSQPLPIGDGVVFLLFLSLVYFLIKRKQIVSAIWK